MGMVSAKLTCLRPPSASASAATDVLETAVSAGSMTSVRAKVALRSGSSQHGKARRASVASNWVVPSTRSRPSMSRKVLR